MTQAPDYNSLERAYLLQKKARATAERLLEDKSRELYMKNQELLRAMEQLRTQQDQIIAQEKMASIGRLAAGMAHELNNPNAFIQNNLLTLKEYVEQLCDACDAHHSLIQQAAPALETQSQQICQRYEVDYIRDDMAPLIKESVDGTNRISAIANSLRFFANPESAKRKPVQVNDCLKQAERLLSEREQQQCTLHYALGELPGIEGMAVLLSQAFVNIIKNAIEAHPEDGNVAIKTALRDDHIHICFSDRGHGFDPAIQTKLFEPFFTTRPPQQGLGLSIAQSIVQQHGGTIRIERNADLTQVHIMLPVAQSSTTLNENKEPS